MGMFGESKAEFELRLLTDRVRGIEVMERKFAKGLDALLDHIGLEVKSDQTIVRKKPTMLRREVK